MKDSFSFTLGMVTGIFFVFLVCLIIYKRRKKMGKTTEYDERQKAIQGKAYKIGFFVTMFSLIANGILCLDTKPWASVIDMNFTGIALGIFAFATYAIWKDAYVALDGKLSRYTWLFAVVGVLNIAVYVINHTLYESDDGLITNVIAGGLFLALSLVAVVKLIYDRVQSKKELDE